MAYIVKTYIVMAYMVMAYIVMACIVMAYIYVVPHHSPCALPTMTKNDDIWHVDRMARGVDATF